MFKEEKMKSNNKNIEWKPISKTLAHSTRIFDIENILSVSPEGEKKTFICLNSPEWAIVVPVIEKSDGKYFVMVRQWRHGSACVLQEFPGGVVNEGETCEDAAKRELLEETGYKVKNIECLGHLYPNPAIMQNYCHIFFAECEQARYEQHTDNDEFIEVNLVPYNEVMKNMGCPPYQHALMCSALFLYCKKYRS